jgi:hypothetical protein
MLYNFTFRSHWCRFVSKAVSRRHHDFGIGGDAPTDIPEEGTDFGS